MLYNLKNMNFTFFKRNAPRFGPTSSDKWNASFEEIKNDLAVLSNEWNQKLVKAFIGLPVGVENSAINAIANGIDGSNLYVSHSLTSSSTDLTYFDTTHDRPATIKEALDTLHTLVSNSIEDLQDYIAQYSAVLTAGQKASIGAHIFDTTQTSSATSIDGKAEVNRLNISQLARDIYGLATLDGDGNANLTNSIAVMVDALLELHNGNWSNDVVLDHSGISVSVSQADINTSSPGNDTFAGAPINLEEDLNQLRTLLKTIKGTLGWQTALTPLYAGGADSIEDLLATTYGTGVQTATNPWGYSITDLDDLDVGLDYLPTQIVESGLPSDVPDNISAQDMFEWIVGTDKTIDGQLFRRLETSAIGPGPWTVNHRRGAYPIVQLVQLSPSVTVSGQFPYDIEHNSFDNFTVTVSGGVSLVDGVIISLW